MVGGGRGGAPRVSPAAVVCDIFSCSEGASCRPWALRGMTPQESSPNPALEARYNSIVTTRVKAGSIVLAHMFVMMSSAVDIRDHDRMDHGLAKAFHVITRIGVPIAALGTYAALCPIDFPPDGVVHVTYWFRIWSALCVDIGHES